MNRFVTVTVIYPVTFKTKIDTNRELYELKEQVKSEADKAYDASAISSVIHQCDDFPELVE